MFVSPQNVWLLHLPSVYSHPINRSFYGESGELSWYKLITVLQGLYSRYLIIILVFIHV